MEVDEGGFMKHLSVKAARRGLLIATLLLVLVALAVPAAASGSVTTSTETFSFANIVPCTGEIAIVEGTLRIVSVVDNGGSVVRLTWTHFRGSGFQIVDGVLVPTGTEWVFSGTSGFVLVIPKNDGTRLRQTSVLRLTSLNGGPNLRVTVVAVLDFNPVTQQFDARVDFENMTCA
jgi:hypothetical protein